MTNQGLEHGLSGWLSPNGEFTPAMRGRHREVALKIQNSKGLNPGIDIISYGLANADRLLEMRGYIKFDCPTQGDNGYEAHVFFPETFMSRNKVTVEQTKWIITNKNKMSTNQRTYARTFLLYNYGVDIEG